MDIFLLDVVDAGVSSSPDKTLLLVLGITILAEAGFMLLARYNNFPTSLWQSATVNAVSLLAGYLLIRYMPDTFNDYRVWKNLLLLLMITIVLEGVVLYLLNQKKPWVYTFIVCVLMNVITYLLFYLLVPHL